MKSQNYGLKIVPFAIVISVIIFGCQTGKFYEETKPPEKVDESKLQDEKIDPKLEDRICDLISELGADDDPGKRDNAQNELTEIGSPARKYLKYTLSHTKDTEVKWRVEEILYIISILKKVNEKNRKLVREILRKVLDNRDYRKRFEIILEIKDKKELTEEEKTLIAKESFPKELTQSIESEEDKRKIIELIKSHKLKFASCVLVGLLEDKDLNVRSDAVWALGKLGAKEYTKDIVKLLEDENFSVRSSAANTLGELGAKEALPDLKKQLEELIEDSIRPEMLESSSYLTYIILRKTIEEAIKKIEQEK